MFNPKITTSFSLRKKEEISKVADPEKIPCQKVCLKGRKPRKSMNSLPVFTAPSVDPLIIL